MSSNVDSDVESEGDEDLQATVAKKRRTRRTYELAMTFATAEKLKEYVERKDNQLSFKEEITDVKGGRTVHYRCSNYRCGSCVFASRGRRQAVMTSSLGYIADRPIQKVHFRVTEKCTLDLGSGLVIPKCTFRQP